jgi:hypothetical protein
MKVSVLTFVQLVLQKDLHNVVHTYMLSLSYMPRLVPSIPYI